MRSIKLTRRQRRFLTDFLKLAGGTQQPLHYADVARALGVRAVTAYEMLRVLEDRGLVVSDYVLNSKGPGRATVVFRPTAEAATITTEAAEAARDEDWEAAKTRLLAALKMPRTRDDADLLESLLQRLEQPRSALLFTTDLLTAAMLTLYHAAGRAAGQRLEQLRRVGLADELGLSMLNGLAIGLSLVDQTNRSVVTRLLHKADAYTQALARLSPGHRRQLLRFAREVVRILRSRASRYAGQPAPATLT